MCVKKHPDVVVAPSKNFPPFATQRLRAVRRVAVSGHGTAENDRPIALATKLSVSMGVNAVSPLLILASPVMTATVAGNIGATINSPCVWLS